MSESVCLKSNINNRRLIYNTQRHARFQSPGEIKRREVVLDPQVSPEEIKSREVELGFEGWTSFSSVVSQKRNCGHCLCDSVPHSG